jgi:hypothetical protein
VRVIEARLLQLTLEQLRPVLANLLIALRLVGARAKNWDYYGVSTRIFERGTEVLVKTLPGVNGKYPYPLLVASNPAP